MCWVVFNCSKENKWNKYTLNCINTGSFEHVLWPMNFLLIIFVLNCMTEEDQAHTEICATFQKA